MKTYSMKCPRCGFFTYKTATKNILGKMCPTCGGRAMVAQPANDAAYTMLASLKLQEAQAEHTQAARALVEAASAANKYMAIARHSRDGYAITEAIKASDAAKEAQTREEAARALVETLRRTR